MTDKPIENEDQKEPEQEHEEQNYNRVTVPKSYEDEPQSRLWLITFTDVMALMLTFFVLLYSMSVPSEEEWTEMTTAINRQFQENYSPEWYSAPQDTISIDKLDFSDALDLGYLRSVVADVRAEQEILKDVVLIPQKDHLIISLPQEILFPPGRADVSTRGKQALFALGGVLSRIRNRIEVIGHADPRPVSSANFENNWELSLIRAVEVSRILRNVGYRRPVSVHGLSSARYDELSGEMSEEERLSLSRRVDIVIMKDDGSRRNVFSM